MVGTVGNLTRQKLSTCQERDVQTAVLTPPTCTQPIPLGWGAGGVLRPAGGPAAALRLPDDGGEGVHVRTVQPVGPVPRGRGVEQVPRLYVQPPHREVGGVCPAEQRCRGELPRVFRPASKRASFAPGADCFMNGAQRIQSECSRKCLRVRMTEVLTRAAEKNTP